jgi:CheY-like chemotaxis protein
MRTVVLVVDDEPDIETLFRQQFRRDLRSGRFEMEFSRSGSAAMDYINDGQTRVISLILSDINMPGMDGIELLQKAKSAKPEVPVIMISAYGDAETRHKALQSGADDLLTKPIDFGALRHAIDKRVERI